MEVALSGLEFSIRGGGRARDAAGNRPSATAARAAHRTRARRGLTAPLGVAVLSVHGAGRRGRGDRASVGGPARAWSRGRAREAGATVLANQPARGAPGVVQRSYEAKPA